MTMIWKVKIIRQFVGLIFLVAILVAAFHVSSLCVLFPEMDFSRIHFGIASWYSEKDPAINKRTANNEIFNDEADTCASWHFPFHEKLLVFNIMNGRWTVCRVNDRGPAKRLGREIDLTHAAFNKIAKSKKGLIPAIVIPINKPRT